MKNPLQLLELLGISEKLKQEDVVNELSKRETELSLLAKIIDEAFRNSTGVAYVSAYSIMPNSSIENMLNARFILGLPINRKYLTAEDLSKLLEMTKERQSARMNGTATEVSNSELKTLRGVMCDQHKYITDERKQYHEVLENYERLKRLASRKGTTQAVKADFAKVNEQLEDLYIKYKFEQSIIDIAGEVADGVPPVKTIGKNSDFLVALQEDPRYVEFEDVYSRANTPEKRGDLFPEIYVQRRMGDVSGLYITTPEEREKIADREYKYIGEFVDTLQKTKEEAYREGIALNRNYGYSWGIILTPKEYYMKDERVDTPIFKGKMTVEKLGEFSESSLFRKRKFLRETDKKTRATTIRSIDESRKVRRFVDTGSTIREAYYAYKATANLYDSIYRVSKTDELGNKTENIVFSPLTEADFKNRKYRDFIKNIYFSDYMLDIAKQNGGYAGVITDTPYGFAIQTKYSTDAIASAIVFDEGLEGSVVDVRNPQHRKDYTSQTKETFMKMIQEEERGQNPFTPSENTTSSRTQKGEKERNIGE